MSRSQSRPWFAAKRYGYGSGLPVAWQGWALLVAFLALFLASAVLLNGPVRWAALFVLVIGVFAIAAVKTQGGWRWRWPGR